MSGLLDTLTARSPRERLLLALTAGVILPAGVGFGVLWPLHQARLAAQEAQTEAIALQQWVVDRAAEAPAQSEASPATQPAPIGLSGIEEGLIAANLRRSLDSIGTESGDVIALRFDEVDFVRLVTWMSSSHPGWGYEIASYSFEQTDTPSRVSARISLRPAEG